MKIRYGFIKFLAICVVMGLTAGPAVAFSLDDAAIETGLDKELIRSIAFEESRRYDPMTGEVRPWPWTLRAEGKALFFETRREAERELRRLRYSGLRNIDVGAMQVNVRWNGDLARTPEDLLDPGVNLWAATQVIRECQSRVGPLVQDVISCYHSGHANNARGQAYAQRVINRFLDNQQTRQVSR